MPTVLIVEDCNLQRRIMVEMLRKLGYAYLESADGNHAIKLMQERHSEVDAVMLDLDLPHIDGISVLGHFKKRYTTIPVMIISGSDDFDNVSLSHQWGVEAYLPKPITQEQLGATLSRLIAPGALALTQ